MSLKEKMRKFTTDSYLKRYGDRLAQIQGNVVSVKIETKKIFWIYNLIIVSLLVRQEGSKSIVKCYYKKHKWFKKPTFIPISQGNLVLVQGLKGVKGKENREQITIMNIRNLSTKKDLIPVEGNEPKIQRVRRQTKNRGF